MSLSRILPVVMAGGSGTRLWPLSRALYPKQFLALNGTQTLFQQAVLRLVALGDDEISVMSPCVIGNEEHRFLALEQLREINAEKATLVLEPCGRNTAPALMLAALHAVDQQQGPDEDPVLVVTPADQAIEDLDAFNCGLRSAIRAADDSSIVILGIQPDRPETGFGYIRADGEDATKSVISFVEKPDLATARGYVEQGGYYWNSGMFVMRASLWRRALKHFRADIATATETAWSSRTTDNGFLRPGPAAFAAVPGESIDYAVLERCPQAPQAGIRVKMVPLRAGWSDLGSWEAVWQVGDKDANGNATHGDVLIESSRNTLVHANSRLVSAVGLDNVVIVETADAVLVADRSRSQDVKNVVNELSMRSRTEGTVHRRVHRPWGWYDSIDAGPRFQVKRIMVKPRASLSLQMHHHRAEHWIVVSGTAEVTCGDKKMLLTENQSTYIPLGDVHRLANPGTIPLEIIEVQSGSYLGEDDIVRFQDTYGRH